MHPDLKGRSKTSDDTILYIEALNNPQNNIPANK